MNRTGKATLAGIFSYAQYVVALVSGVLLIPFVLHKITAPVYGLWLACGDLLAYCAMTDLGVLAILPWLIAENDGRRDRAAIRALLVNSLATAATVGVVFAAAGLLCWPLAVAILHLNDEQRHFLAGPLLVVLGGAACGFPMRVFLVTLSGLQDVRCTGSLGIAQSALSILLTVVLLLSGGGLYALAYAAALPPLVTFTGGFLRLRRIAPDLLTGWTRPTLPQILHLLQQGIGPWLSSLGWRMISATNNLIIVSVSTPAAAVVYACTAKLGDVLMPVAWIMPDSALVGLAQLRGESNHERLRAVVLTMLRLIMISAGAVAFFYLLVNPTFVPLWVGRDKFGGFLVMALLAGNYLAHSLIHGLIAPASILANRFQVGVITLVQGAFDVVGALTLGHFFGLAGVASSSLFSTALVAFPLAFRLLASTGAVSAGSLWEEALLPSLKILPLLLLAGVVGGWAAGGMPWRVGLAGPLAGLLFLWYLSPLYIDLPLPLKLRACLARVRLIPRV